MTARDHRPLLRIGHSPDPDDAFMWWPLLDLDGAGPRVDTGRFRFAAEPADIEALNQRSAGADLEITALSCAQYPHVAGAYAMTACGASMGDRYGPKLVAREPMTAPELCEGDRDAVLAIPGERTSAFAATSLLLGPGAFQFQVVPFDEIIDRVQRGEYSAGIVIHEGQLTYESAGLHLIADLGAWWFERTGDPLPLGINAIRRDLEVAHGSGTLAEVTETLLQSVRYALAHREESIRYALNFARGMSAELADEFVGMYVNKWTLDFGETGRAAVRTFLRQLADARLVPSVHGVDFILAEPRR